MFKQYATMEGKLTIEDVRCFLAAANRQFEQGGIFIGRIRFRRSETGDVEDIFINYEERNATDESEGGQVYVQR